MKELNNNTYLVLVSIRDKENNKGLCKARGMSKCDIVTKSGLSESTVDRALKVLLECGYIKEAIKQINKKAYYISQEEMQEVLYDLYDSDVFEIDYENQTITIY